MYSIPTRRSILLCLSVGLFCLTITGCSSIPRSFKTPPPSKELRQPDASFTAKAVIYRAWSLNASREKMAFGINRKIYVNLDNNQWSVIPLPPGRYHFWVRGTYARKAIVQAEARPHQTLCFIASPDPKNWLKIPSFAVGSFQSKNFLLKRVNCRELKHVEPEDQVRVQYNTTPPPGLLDHEYEFN